MLHLSLNSYEYLEQLKNIDLYDSSTIIIMADHSPLYGFDDIIEEAGINGARDNKPIMFIKRPNEKHNNIIINNNDTTNEYFQATIIKLIDSENTNYGKAVWE